MQPLTGAWTIQAEDQEENVMSDCCSDDLQLLFSKLQQIVFWYSW